MMSPKSKGRPLQEPRTDFESRLRHLMDAAHISNYAALAKAANISTDTIQRLCSGKRSIGMAVAKKLASALKCNINDLIL